MQRIGVLIECSGDRLKPANLGMIGGAFGSDAAVTRRVYALALQPLTEEDRRRLGEHGAADIVELVLPGNADPRNPAHVSAAVVEVMTHFELEALVGLTSHWGRDLLPRVAATLDVPLVMDCIHVDLDRRTVETTHYSGKTIATISLDGTPVVVGVRPNALAPVARPAKPLLHEHPVAPPDDDRLTVREVLAGTNAGVDLSEAQVIVAGGRGMRNGDNFKILQACADALNAAVGASRVAVDEGWAPYAQQVGQTGAKVNPKVYIACGISGSVQHYAGIKSSGVIVAVNKDPDAAIIANSDFYIVGDLFEIVPLLTRRLTELAASAER